MQDRPNNRPQNTGSPVPAHPLRSLTPAQFMALGGNAVVYVRTLTGAELFGLISDADFEAEEILHMVVSGDGSPLLVADTEEAVSDWLLDKNFGIVTLH